MNIKPLFKECLTEILIGNTPDTPKSPDKTCVVRAYSAGLFWGDVAEQESDGNSRATVVMNNCIRIWGWKGALCNDDIATNGVKEGGCKFSHATNGKTIFGVIEITPMSEKAITSLKEVKPYVE